MLKSHSPQPHPSPQPPPLAQHTATPSHHSSSEGPQPVAPPKLSFPPALPEERPNLATRLVRWCSTINVSLAAAVARYVLRPEQATLVVRDAPPLTALELLRRRAIVDQVSQSALIHEGLIRALQDGQPSLGNPFEFIPHCRATPAIPPDCRYSLAKQCLAMDPARTLKDLSNFSLTEESTTGLLSFALSRAPGVLKVHSDVLHSISSEQARDLVTHALSHAMDLLPAIIRQIHPESVRAATVTSLIDQLKERASAASFTECIVSLAESCPSLSIQERTRLAMVLPTNDYEATLSAWVRIGELDFEQLLPRLERARGEDVHAIMRRAEFINSLPVRARYQVLTILLEAAPATVIENLAPIHLTDELLSAELARAAVEVKPATTAHHIKAFKLSTAARIEIGKRSLEKSPDRAIPFISEFGDAAPELARVFWRWVTLNRPSRAGSHIEVLRHLPEPERALEWRTLFTAQKKPSLCSKLGLLAFESPESIRIVTEAVRTHSPSLLQRCYDALRTEPPTDIQLEALRPRIAKTPWVVLNRCITHSIADQDFLRVVLSECFRRNAQRAVRELRAVSSLTEETRESLLDEWVTQAPAAFEDSPAMRAPLPPHSRAKLVSHVAAQEPLDALELFKEGNLRDEPLLLSILIRHLGPRRSLTICRDLSQFTQFSAATRFAIARVLCKGEVMLMEQVSFGLRLDSEQRRDLIREFSAATPEAYAGAIRKLGIYEPDLITSLIEPHKAAELQLLPAADQQIAFTQALASVRRNVRKAAQNIHSMGLARSEDRHRVAEAIASAHFDELCPYIHRFGLSENQRAQLLERWTSSADINELVTHFGITDSATAQQILLDSASRNFRQITDRATLRSFYRHEDAVWQVFHRSLMRGKINNALFACIIQHENTTRIPPGHPRPQRQVLSLFDTFLARSLAEPGLDPAIRKELELISRVRKYGVAPSVELMEAFDHFADDADSFLCEIYSQAGPTGGANIADQLIGLYEKGASIPVMDQEVIRIFLAKGFRGFSAKTFELAKTAYRQSPQQAERCVQGWKDAATVIVKGIAVPPEMARDPLFPEMVYAAYRPVGMSLSNVKSYLTSVKDHSSRLARFKFPAEGYPTTLHEHSEIVLREGEQLAVTEISSLIDLFTKRPAVSADQAEEIIVKASQRGVGSLAKPVVVGWMLNDNGDPRIKALVEKLSSLAQSSNTPQQARQTLFALQEGLGVICSDALDHALTRAIDGKEFAMRDRFIARMRTLLGKRGDETLADTEIRAALREELEKVFRAERQLVSRELKKFSSGGSRATPLRTYVSLSKSSFFGRAGAGLCSATDVESWDSPHFLQMITVDTERQLIVANTQLHLFTSASGASILARVNPTEKFLTEASPRAIARALLGCVEQFASDNDLVPYLPEQTWAHLLTNRAPFAPALTAYYGPTERIHIKVLSDHRVERVYKMKPMRK